MQIGLAEADALTVNEPDTVTVTVAELVQPPVVPTTV
jgi:hypothetical protein